MKKFIPKDKLSKKKQKELNNEKRNFWMINPITKVTKDINIYDRNKDKKKWKNEIE